MPPPPELTELVARCILLFERDGRTAMEQELARAGDLAAAAQEQLRALLEAGLLRAPEQPEQIGPYRVLERLGAGGMGTVWLCEQSAPLPRRVAVKVIRPGMDSREVLARFHLERQAMARLSHPHLARALDAGTTQDGRPYLVMEYVPGVSITRYCDDHRLDTRARLQLFAQVCDAVQHAHQKGILHRDLKPSNILVADRDGTPFPVVIDFGVAKAVTGLPTGATLLTLPGHLLGTPEYMSPEQATNDQDVDTRTDVYSLGVVLYELLTGALPIGSERLKRSRDIAAVLREVEPPTPSTRISSLGDGGPAAAQRRGTDTTSLQRQLRGDLDWIVLKALAKDRNHRYGMPSELAADVRAHLRSEPIVAGRPSRWHRARKFMARHRLGVGAATAVLLTLCAGTVTSLVFYREAAASSRASAQSLDDALQAVGALVQVGDTELVAVPHLDLVRRQLLDRSVAFYQQFLARAPEGDARVQRRIADARVRLGCLQLQLGQFGPAATSLRAGVAQAEAAGPALLPIQARGRAALAELLERNGETAAARAELQASVGLATAALQAAPDDHELRVLLVATLLRQGQMLRGQDAGAALAAFEAAAAAADPFLQDRARHQEHLPAVLAAGIGRARQLLDLGRRDEGVRELALQQQRWRELSDSVRDGSGASATDWQLATMAAELGGLFRRCDQLTPALAMVEAVVSAHARFVQDHPRVLAYRTGLATARSEQAAVLLSNWRITEGVAAATAAATEHQAALALAPADATLLANAALAEVALTQAQLEAQRQRAAFDLQAARAANGRAFTVLDRLAALPDVAATEQRVRMEALRHRAMLQADPGGAAAIADLQAALQIVERLLAADPAALAVQERRVELQTRLAAAQLAGGDATAALALAQSALQSQGSWQQRADSQVLWAQRRRTLLQVQAKAAAALQQVDLLLSSCQEHLDLAWTLDWGGRQDVARLLLQQAQGPLAGHPRAGEVLDRARAVARLGLAAGAEYAAGEGRSAGPAMIAGMRAANWQILADIEAAAGAARARAQALGEVAAAHAEARSGQGAARLLASCRAWAAALPAGDPDAAVPAFRRMGEWFAGDAEALLAAAVLAARCAAALPAAAAPAVRSEGRALLQAARQAGAAAAAIDAEPVLATLADGGG